MKHITIPESVVKIGKGAFAGMCALESADVRVPWIEWRRYGKAKMLIDKRRDELLLCTGVEYVKIPREVKSIGEYAFAGNKELKRVKFHNGLECVGEGAFSNCTGLEEVTVAGVEELGDVFYGCDNLRKEQRTEEAGGYVLCLPVIAGGEFPAGGAGGDRRKYVLQLLECEEGNSARQCENYRR